MTLVDAVVEPGPALSPGRLARYSRQLAMPGFDELAQRRLANARVLVVGAGGLGSASIPYLASAGVGTIGVIDTDVVELSNLHRQVSHGMVDSAADKVDSIARHRGRDRSGDDRAAARGVARLEQRDRDFRGLRPHPGRQRQLRDPVPRERRGGALGISPWCGARFFGTADSPAWSTPVTDRAIATSSPLPPPGDALSCSVGGVLPTVCAVIGSIMCTEAIKLITGIGEPLIGRVTTYDALSGRFREISYRAIPDAAPITELIDYELFCGRKPAEPAQAASEQSTRPGDLDQRPSNCHSGASVGERATTHRRARTLRGPDREDHRVGTDPARHDRGFARPDSAGRARRPLLPLRQQVAARCRHPSSHTASPTSCGSRAESTPIPPRSTTPWPGTENRTDRHR